MVLLAEVRPKQRRRSQSNARPAENALSAADKNPVADKGLREN